MKNDRIDGRIPWAFFVIVNSNRIPHFARAQEDFVARVAASNSSLPHGIALGTPEFRGNPLQATVYNAETNMALFFLLKVIEVVTM